MLRNTEQKIFNPYLDPYERNREYIIQNAILITMYLEGTMKFLINTSKYLG